MSQYDATKVEVSLWIWNTNAKSRKGKIDPNLSFYLLFGYPKSFCCRMSYRRGTPSRFQSSRRRRWKDIAPFSKFLRTFWSVTFHFPFYHYTKPQVQNVFILLRLSWAMRSREGRVREFPKICVTDEALNWLSTSLSHSFTGFLSRHISVVNFNPGEGKSYHNA